MLKEKHSEQSFYNSCNLKPGVKLQFPNHIFVTSTVLIFRLCKFETRQKLVQSFLDLHCGCISGKVMSIKNVIQELFSIRNDRKWGLHAWAKPTQGYRYIRKTFCLIYFISGFIGLLNVR
jgi:hypothetical protein